MWRIQSIDRLRSHDTQYEHMLGEYCEFVEAARAKLTCDPRLHVDSLDDLRQHVSSLSVSDLVLSCFVIND